MARAQRLAQGGTSGTPPEGAEPGTPPEGAEPGAAPEGAESGTVLVSTVPGVARLFRAGLCFGPQPSALVVAELGEGVLQRLQAEPRLWVRLAQDA